MPESPVCTCVKRTVETRFGLTKIIQVLDPFCQIQVHKERGSTAFEPTYGKGAKE
ncbi:hypothetical protein SEA_CREWMATE_70 [Arthrobacter phage Crewmate]|uniref:Uncharacterized protein n=1 Tax=Arthrobacter phage Crewmate TaxID=2832317 RepID=A0AA49B3Z4_9CAUD|nr:hypothetical protein PQE17_gp70 [Arthrobacter phage Crewmate]UIW13321.1 hypothetical protein SEA_CREWMATE_70 [Arthrobacter phage Crewmate]WGH21246.1 hypothetical protein SEA_OBITOO_70 [Arthrobacter phage ObiToo]